jgi:DNA-binding CsgD family transcriptional regulator/tetratricopeptide (TPR) repeat protein
VLGADARLRAVATVAGLELEDAARLGDQLTGAGLLASATPLAFAAQVVRNVVYETIPPGQRALLHLAAARALAAAGASESAIVGHLMRSEPADDPAAATLLRRAARDARAVGDPAGAVRLLSRAPAEPPSEAERNPILLELGVLESRLVLPAAESHLGKARYGGGPRERGEATLELADLNLLAGRKRDAHELLERELMRLEPDAHELALRLAAELDACGIAAGAPRRGGWWRGGIDGLSGGQPGERERLAVAAAGAALEGEPRDIALALAERALGRESLFARGGLGTASSMFVLFGLQTAEEPSLASARIEAELAAVGARGSLIGEAAALSLRSRSLLARGSLRQAEADARRTLALSREHALGLLEPLALASLVEALVDQGRLPDAGRALLTYAHWDGTPDDFGGCLLVIARGRLRAASGEAHLGVRDLLAAGARLLRSACRTPSFDWRSRAGLLAHRLDRPAEAARLIEDELALAQRLGAARPLGVALRARALIAPPALQIELLEEAVAALRHTPAKLDCARALCDLGGARRRSGSRNRGREPLQEALQLAHECGAVALAQRARHELIVLGARPRRHAVTGIEALTVRERQASELAAAGLTNRQIAATMTVTPNTVEYHLTNAYRKLGITTREGLPAELGRDGGATDGLTQAAPQQRHRARTA